MEVRSEGALGHVLFGYIDYKQGVPNHLSLERKSGHGKRTKVVDSPPLTMPQLFTIVVYAMTDPTPKG